MIQTIHITVLDYPNAMPSAVFGIEDIFTIANTLAERQSFSIQRFSQNDSIEGNKHTVLFVPPSLSPSFTHFSSAEMFSLLRRWHQSGTIVAAACTGVFGLAYAGLLKGKHATTHWRLCQKLANDFPDIDHISARDIIVDEGDVITAAGLYAFQDLALHIIARFKGFELAKKVADYCLLDFNGRLQAYYQRFQPNFFHHDAMIVRAQQFCDQQVYSNLHVHEIAQHVNTSERTLLRRFKKATGFTPKQYIMQLKIEKARQLLELENLSVEATGDKLGYADTSNFIKAFKNIAGITPAEFRARQTNS